MLQKIKVTLFVKLYEKQKHKKLKDTKLEDTKKIN